MNNDIILLFWICIFYDQARIKYYKDCYSSMLSYSDTLSWFWVNQFCDLTAPCCHTLTHYIDSEQTNSVFLQLHVVILWHIILILSKPILWSYSSMLSYSDTLSWFWANQFCVLIPFYCILSRKARNTGTNFIVFGLTTLGHDRMIYCTWGEHANHYTTTCMS
jgi:hypothetical protein